MTSSAASICSNKKLKISSGKYHNAALNIFHSSNFSSYFSLLPQPSLVVTPATQPTGGPMAASSTSMMLSTSPVTEVTSSVEMLVLSADSTDSGAAPCLSAKVTNTHIDKELQTYTHTLYIPVNALDESVHRSKMRWCQMVFLPFHPWYML